MSTMYLTSEISLDVHSVQMFIQGKYSFLTFFFMVTSYHFLIKVTSQFIKFWRFIPFKRHIYSLFKENPYFGAHIELNIRLMKDLF